MFISTQFQARQINTQSAPFQIAPQALDNINYVNASELKGDDLATQMAALFKQGEPVFVADSTEGGPNRLSTLANNYTGPNSYRVIGVLGEGNLYLHQGKTIQIPSPRKNHPRFSQRLVFSSRR